jgi:hypothetical protein
MFNPLANGRMYENTHSMKSKRIYARLESKSDDILRRYQKLLQSKGAIDNFLALLDTDKQLKISCLENVLLSRNGTNIKSESSNESNCLGIKSYGNISVNLMSSDYDMKSLNEKENKRRAHPYSAVFSRIMSKGYFRP